MLIEATPTSLTGRALTTNETVIDRFRLQKRSGRAPEKYLAQVYPEETLKLSLDAAPSLTADLNLVPDTHSTAQVMFTVRPMKTTQHPVELEVGLTPDSALYYELEGGALRISTPSMTESNKVVWAEVRATGQKKVEAVGQSRSLVPALTFQAKVRTGTAETLAYGQKCKVSAAAAEAAKNWRKRKPSR